MLRPTDTNTKKDTMKTTISNFQLRSSQTPPNKNKKWDVDNYDICILFDGLSCNRALLIERGRLPPGLIQLG